MDVNNTGTVLQAIQTLGAPMAMAAYFAWRDWKREGKEMQVLLLIAQKLGVDTSLVQTK